MTPAPVRSRAIAVGACIGVVLAACAAPSGAARPAPPRPLPLTVQGAALSLRAESRPLTADRVDLLIHVVARAAIARLRISATSTDPGLTISPNACVLFGLSPPRAPGSRGPPYPLPLVPTCNLVLTGARPATFPVRIRISDAGGVDLLAPIDTVIAIPGAT